MTGAANGHDDVDLFIRLDRIGATLGATFVILANGFVVGNGAVWLVVPILLVLVAVLTAARRALRDRSLPRALTLVAGGNWFTAMTIPMLLPFLWPVMALTVLMPLVLSSPHLSRRQIMPAIVASALVTSVVATIGLLNDDGGAINDIDDSAELIIVIGALIAQIVPLGLVAWQHNHQQRANFDNLAILNTELVASEAELEASRDRVVQAADSERRRIERDLHDGAQQRLVALGVRMRLLQSQGHEDVNVRDGIDTLIGELDGAIAEVRELAHGIYPPLLQTRGLPDALAPVVRRSPVEVHTEIGEVNRFDQAIESALYFTALEALTNVAKHAPLATVDLKLAQHENHVELVVSDDGDGFDTQTAVRSHGFNNMADRLAVVGGRLDVSSQLGIGTTIRATVPTQADAVLRDDSP